MHFHFVALLYFKETVERGSIRQAGEALNVAASAVNRQVLKLEEQLGCDLFERVAGGMRLTGAGEVFYAYVLRNAQDFDRTLSEIEDLRGIRRGHVSICCEEGFAKDFLPRVLKSFHEAFPRVSYKVEVAGLPSVVSAVAGGTADIGIGFEPDFDADLGRAAEVHVELGAAMAPDHALAKCEGLHLSDLVGEPLILPDANYDIHNRLNKLTQGAGLKLSRIVETNSFEAMTSLIVAGLGVGLRTRVGISAEIERGDLAFVPIVDRMFRSTQVVILTKARRALPVAAALLCERLVAFFAAFAEMKNSGARQIPMS